MVKPPRTRQMRNEDFASGQPISTDYVKHPIYEKNDVQKAYNYKKLHTKKDYIMIPKGTKSNYKTIQAKVAQKLGLERFVGTLVKFRLYF